MTREEVKSCIGTIEMLQRLAYNIHGVMDVIDADNCKKIIKALEQEPTIENKIDAELRQQDDGLILYFDEDGVAHKYDDTYDITIHCDDENHQEKLLKLLRKYCVKRKVNYSFDGYYNGDPVVDTAECPNCEHEFEFDTPEWEANYCPACGQALDWEVEEAPEDE